MYTNEINNSLDVESGFDGIFDGDSDYSPIDDPVEIHHDIDLDNYCISETLFAELKTTDSCDCEFSSCETLRSDSNSLLYLVANGTRMKSTAVRKKRKNPPTKMAALPADFQPTPYSIICGRGKETYNYIGKSAMSLTKGPLFY